MARNWVICPECGGEGKSSAHLGVINREDWDFEELEDYFDGAYDKACGFCDGSGKVLEGDLERIEEKKQDWLLFCAESGISPY